MKCVIGEKNLPAWYRIIHRLVEIGDDEVFFDFAERIMTVSTTNSSMSTFSTFILFRSFFESYSMTSEQPEKIAIPSKIILKPFRNQRMAKNHISTEMDYKANGDTITITSLGKSRACSTYRLGASEHNEEIQFEGDPYAYKNLLKIDAKVLINCLSNFSHMKGLSELSLKVHGQRVTLKNTVDDVTRKDGSVVTEFNLTSHDFINFEVQDDEMEFAFGFREFKQFTTFAEQLKLPVHIHFHTIQDPVIIVVKNETFEARLCLATRIDDPFTHLGTRSNITPQSQSSVNGRISNATSQSSVGSSRNASGASQEVNRHRENVSRTETNPAVTVNNPEPPPSKRIRRTEAAPPLAEISQSRISFQNDEPDGGGNDIEMVYQDVDEPPLSPVPVAPSVKIGELVDKLEKRNNSPSYKAITRLLSRPRRSEQEYLKTIPGHDVVLCPDSDEEDSNS